MLFQIKKKKTYKNMMTKDALLEIKMTAIYDTMVETRCLLPANLFS